MQIEADAISIQFEIPAQDALGLQEVEGKVQGMEDAVFLHWKLRDNPFKNETNEITTIKFAYHEIESVELQSKLFRPKHLILKVCDPKKISDIPGVSMGKADLVIAKASKNDVDRLAKFLDYKVSEYRMLRTEERMDALRSGDDESTDSELGQ